MAGPLEGIRVFDLTLAGVGPLASRLLAEFGAEVIKIEAPGDGDVMLTRPPTQRGLPVGYTYFNQGKKAAVFDLRNDADRELCYRLIERSDVFVNNMRPGAAERLGFSYDDLRRLNPRLIYGYASAWGREGPLASWPGADPVVQFYSAWCSIQGEAGGLPEFSRFVGHLDGTTAVNLVGGILQALIYRESTSRGQRVDVSILGCSLASQITRLAEHLAGQTPGPMGTACTTTVPHQAFLCGDQKYLAIGVEHDDQWQALCAALAAPELATDPRFATNPERVRNRAELIPLLADIFRKRPTNWWRVVLERHRVPHGRFYDWENLRYHTQVRDNDFISLVEVPLQGSMYLVNAPWKFSQWERPRLPVTRPGEHTDEVHAWLAQLPKAVSGNGHAAEPAVDGSLTERQPSERPRALTGLVMVDTTQGLCGPYTSQLLADAGATVIKIEPPQGDYARQMGPPFVGDQSAVFLALNRNKQSVQLDLADEAGLAALRRLVERADIFLEDWGPGVAEQRGCGYEQLSAANPGLICGSISPFGEHGPFRDRPASELVVQAMAEYHGGLGAVGGPPVRMGADVANLSTAMLMGDALLAAIYHRQQTGRGQRVDVSQLASLLYHRGTVWASQSDPDDWDGWAARPFAPQEHGYQTKDGRIYFFMLRGDQEQFDLMMIELGLEDHLLDPRFHNGGRDAVGIGRYGPELKPIWEAAFQERTTAELVELLKAHSALAAPMHTYESLLSDPLVAPLGLIQEMDHPSAGSFKHLRPTWRFSELSDDPGNPPPLLGQHTDEVLATMDAVRG
jgi:crotonobetainyl-CoA:carnitine CoA-transferase CaiB-like acyl-CoA transferase